MSAFVRRASTTAVGRIAPLRYLLILDFEATCWESGSRTKQEIIEFPTLLYDTQQKRVQATFHKYVRPVREPKLSEFCTRLTGIEQATVDATEPFPSVWKSFQAFLDEHGVFKNPPSYSFLCCGDWDIKFMLPSQLEYEASKEPPDSNSTSLPPRPSPLADRWINIKKVVQKKHQLKHAKGMMGMLGLLKIAHEGKHHSGIDDCKNIAKIVERMQAEGWKPSTQDFRWMPGRSVN